jgi:hypothetical protein
MDVLFEVPKIFQNWKWYQKTDPFLPSYNGINNAFMAVLEAGSNSRNQYHPA